MSFSEADLQRARRAGSVRRRLGLWAREISFDRKRDALDLVMAAGWRLSIPRRLIAALDSVPDDVLGKLELSPDGSLIHLHSADIHMSVEALVGSLMPPSLVFRRVGSLGGRVSSEAKRAAARANGAKGGRPRKVAAS